MFSRRHATVWAIAAASVPALIAPAFAAGPLQIVYPPTVYETTAESIFVIGSAAGAVTVNGKPVETSPNGNFGPSLPLVPGENVFTFRAGDRSIIIRVMRRAGEPAPPRGASFGAGSLLPATDLARQPNEMICLEAIAPPGAKVTASLAGKTVTLAPAQAMDLPDNKAALTAKNQPTQGRALRYQGCLRLAAPGKYGKPVYRVEAGGATASATAAGNVEILDPNRYIAALVLSEAGVARTGPSTDFSRLTPLPRGTQALVTGREGSWLRLGYGGWLDGQEARLVDVPAPPSSIIRSIGAKRVGGWTEVSFPLQAAVPVAVAEGDGQFTLSLFGTTAQTDIIHVDRDPLIDWLAWTQVAPDRIDYTFHLKRPHPWGYKLAYDGTTLKLALRHPPTPPAAGRPPLDGIRIVLDPGHGGPEDPGTSGPTGIHEKDVSLIVSRHVRDRLRQLGADVVMTREQDLDVGLKERQEIITKSEPTLSVSLHYNALPDNGDVLHTQGVGGFWYHPQAQPLAAFMQRWLVEKLGRPSYGLFWDNLALTRPAVAPSVLMELAFLTNPYEVEWAGDPGQQQKLGVAIADGLAAYCQQGMKEPVDVR
ncbi:MAG: N-acetylmuramoyl-L-alanine amidase [Cyanobacteria bacterium RYN_339]|nr:N-acetylmuramoyl-L-alanine amidase [Cyanobacteria bacterium RYN_339]